MDAMGDGAKAFVDAAITGLPAEPWGQPDMSILRLNRRAPPVLPLDVFGEHWARWITGAAQAAAAPVDYVAMPLLASASSLIGNARWAQATPGWQEPPHLWVGVVGDSGSSKSPGADCLMGKVLPVLESKMGLDFPDRVAEWHTGAELQKARIETWEKEVRTALKTGNPPPARPTDTLPPEPQKPRLRQNDVTVERVASLLATAAPKGLLIVRDELAGWLQGLNAYNDSGRAFWLESYGGRPYRVERQKHPEPIIIPRLAVAVTGGTQPEKLTEMFKNDADDGLFARFMWAWPEPLPFRLGQDSTDAEFAIDAMDRLRLLDLAAAGEESLASPIMVPLVHAALPMLEDFALEMQAAQANSAGLMRSNYGKARGLALRISLNLEMLRWCGEPGMTPPPVTISETSLIAACHLVADYFMPMAERVYGDAAALPAERNATTLARWIMRETPGEVHVRALQRDVRLPGLGTAEAIHAAAALLVEADWLRKPAAGGFQSKPRGIYRVNPALKAAAP